MLQNGLKYKTDKVTHHGYERFYDYFLIPLQQFGIQMPNL